jgi:hypothetical protein
MSTHQAVCEILKREGIDSTVYIDDYILIDYTLLGAQAGFARAKSLLTDLGIDQSFHKEQQPTQIIHWIGYLINTIDMTVSISPDKITEIMALLEQWAQKSTATSHQMQKLLGKLLYVSRCCNPARLFVGRMLHTLRETPDSGCVKLRQPFKADVNWFRKFLPAYNAIHLIDPSVTYYDIHITVDRHQVRCSYMNRAYIMNIPISYQDHTVHCKLLWAVLIISRLWLKDWNDSKIQIHSPSASVTNLINSGASRKTEEMTIARNIWLASAIANFTINATLCTEPIPHVINPISLSDQLIQTVNNVYPDL